MRLVERPRFEWMKIPFWRHYKRWFMRRRGVFGKSRFARKINRSAEHACLALGKYSGKTKITKRHAVHGLVVVVLCKAGRKMFGNA
jgi:hypothetical protein